MDEEIIARLNIQHFYRKLAETETEDERTRRTILRLLAEEEEKLRMLRSAPRRRAYG